eukprot:m.258197 g.258197  ORF g.258197 m.258197 type:complete len:57 (+) comp19643_c1_seq10:391-561(+)
MQWCNTRDVEDLQLLTDSVSSQACTCIDTCVGTHRFISPARIFESSQRTKLQFVWQ